jgi:lysophospholipase L1-like esterase
MLDSTSAWLEKGHSMESSRHNSSWTESSTPSTVRPWTVPGRIAVLGCLVGCLGVIAAACSSDSGTESGTGGHAGGNAGGTSATGGTTTVGSGGTVAAGGSRTGGTTGTGGSSATGGTPATGGTSAGGTGSGGALDTGGSVATGGTRATGGISGTGGSNNTGGRAGAGGSASTGGVTGGRGGTGGPTATGGTSGLGGTAGRATGGTLGTGGARPDGGSPDVIPDSGVDTGTTFAPCPTTPGTACAILPLGDSITEGCCTAPMGGYRIELFRQATKDGKNITFVGSLTNGPSTVENKTFPQHHEGHGGYTMDSGTGHNGISGQITDNALTNYKPHIVLLMIGTNDINGNVDTANAPTRLGKLMDDITTRAPSALLVVASIIPSKTDGTNTNFQKYNAAIPGLVDTRAKAGKHIVFLDNYKAFSQNSNYKTALMADNLHPNDAGYVVLGQSFYGVIGALLPPAP